MELEALGTLLSSTGVGAAIGGVFGWLNRREDRKARAADQQYKLDMVEKKSAAEEKVSEAKAFEVSQQTHSKIGDAIKSAVRPLITAALLYLVYDIFTQLETQVKLLDAFPPEEAAKLYREVVLNTLSLTAVAVSWWFAARPTAVRQLNL